MIQYMVEFEINGIYSTIVEANDKDDAINIATAEFEAIDFENITIGDDTGIYKIEDEKGNIEYFK